VQEVAEAAAQGDRSENAEYIYGKKRLREIDRLVRSLTQRLEDAVVVKPKAQPGTADSVRFGAQVEIEDEDGQRRTYVLLGPEESDPKNGRLSFKSPLGQSLMKRRVGDVVVVRRPAGDIEVRIVSITYP
jgi:transcription elongation factor GreB